MFFFITTDNNNIVIITTQCTIIIIIIIKNYYYDLFSLSLLCCATLVGEYTLACVPGCFLVYFVFLGGGWGWGGGGEFVLGQFSFRAPESVTLRTTNGKKITLKNRQLPLATQAKYTLIDLSVQVRFTVVQNI